MKHHAKRTNLAFITISGLMLSSHAYSLETPIYKWQDHRGITQYSDRAPTVAYTKASRFEMINAMQAKDLCAVPASSSSVFLPKSNVASTATPSYSANLINVIDNSMAAAALNAKLRADGLAKAAIAASNKVIAAAKTAARVPTGQITNAPQAGAKATAGVPTGQITNAPKAGAKAAAAAAAAKSAAAQAAAKTETAAPLLNTKTPTTIATNTQIITTQTPTATLPKVEINPNLIQRGLMPAVDTSKNIVPAVGYSTLRIKDTSQMPTINPNPYGGEFRIVCTTSHMSNDDPLVYPNQPGAAHHHMFFGNTTINARTDLNNLPNVGNSTCSGGIMNRSGYWAPSMIDTTTHTPMVPDFAIFYYKAGGAPGAKIVAPPKGLKMIGGNSKGNSSSSGKSAYTCIPPNDGVVRPFYGWYKSIPACEVGWEMDMSVFFNQCWDGVNLDSPDHQSHMAGGSDANNTPERIAAGTANRCPDSHPIAIPQITLNMRYKVKPGMDLSKWRLASDNYDSNLPGGYSSHADWVNGWDEQIMAGIIKNCINIQGDCHAHLLGAGKTFY